MVKIKLNFIIIIIFVLLSQHVMSDSNTDQWIDSNKTYKDLIKEGFVVKGYAINTIETNNGLKLLLFVTVLQNQEEVYECQEYQTLNDNLETLDLTIVCKELVQPYERGLGT